MAFAKIGSAACVGRGNTKVRPELKPGISPLSQGEGSSVVTSSGHGQQAEHECGGKLHGGGRMREVGKYPAASKALLLFSDLTYSG